MSLKPTYWIPIPRFFANAPQEGPYDATRLFSILMFVLLFGEYFLFVRLESILPDVLEQLTLHPTQTLIVLWYFVAVFSVPLCYGLMLFAQRSTDHHRYPLTDGATCSPSKFLYSKSYSFMVFFHIAAAFISRMALPYGANLCGQMFFMTNCCTYFCELAPCLPAPVTRHTGREMAQTGSVAHKADGSVTKNLLVFYNRVGDVNTFIGTGFVFTTGQERWIVTAHHVFQSSNSMSRAGEKVVHNFEKMINDKKLVLYANLNHDYVMLKMMPELYSLFGGGFVHIVPKRRYADIRVPYLGTQVVLYSGKSYTAAAKPGYGTLRHTATTEAGCSGSPCLIFDKGMWKVFGIHLGFDPITEANYGTYFGLIKTAREETDTLASQFTESAMAMTQSGRMQRHSYEDWARDFSDRSYEDFEDEFNRYYFDSEDDDLIHKVSKTRGKKSGFVPWNQVPPEIRRHYEDEEDYLETNYGNDYADSNTYYREKTRPLFAPAPASAPAVAAAPRKAKKEKKKKPVSESTLSSVQAAVSTSPKEPEKVLKELAPSASTISSKTSGPANKNTAATSPREPSSSTPSSQPTPTRGGKRLPAAKQVIAQKTQESSQTILNVLKKLSFQELEAITDGLPKEHNMNALVSLIKMSAETK